MGAGRARLTSPGMRGDPRDIAPSETGERAPAPPWSPDLWVAESGLDGPESGLGPAGEKNLLLL